MVVPRGTPKVLSWFDSYPIASPIPPNARITGPNTPTTPRQHQEHFDHPTAALTHLLTCIADSPQREDHRAQCAYDTLTARTHCLPSIRGFATTRTRQQSNDSLPGHPHVRTIFSESEGGQLLPLILDLFNAQAIGGLGVFIRDTAGTVRLRVIHGIQRYPGTITQPSAKFGNTFG
eukprot:jgi/Psemu1/436/gm1.436_g